MEDLVADLAVEVIDGVIVAVDEVEVAVESVMEEDVVAIVKRGRRRGGRREVESGELD